MILFLAEVLSRIMSTPSTSKSSVYSGHHLRSSTKKSLIFISAWCLWSTRLHLENIIHGIAWQIIYPLGYCSKLVSRWGFRFSSLSQRKVNKKRNTQNPSSIIAHWQVICFSYSCCTQLWHFSLLFCYQGEMWINNNSDVSDTQMLGPSSSCVGHVFWPLLVPLQSPCTGIYL